MSDKIKRRIALFQPRFLSISMTFIYRQLLAVADDFEPLVMTTRISNPQHFPYDHVAVRPKSPLENLYSTAVRRAFGRYLPMASRRKAHWKRVILDNDIQMLHAHFGYAGVEVLDLARSLSLPLLVTFHGADASNMLERRLYVRDLQKLFDYASIVAVSETMARRLESIGARRDKLFVHYIGAPVEDFTFVQRRPVSEKAAAGEPITFLQVANFVEKKGHRYTLQAFARLADQYPACRLVLAGGGPLKEGCEKLASELGIADRVTFTGPVAKQAVIGLMGDADIFVHHSVTARNGSQEGLPTVLMEAMATGLPVVSTVHAGIPELVRDGVNGFLVAERDVDAYAGKLVDVLDAPVAMARNASSTVHEQFNLALQTKKLKAIYAQVMEASAGGAAGRA